MLQRVNAACTRTLLPTADVVLKWFVLAPLHPLTVLVLFRCEEKIISLRCRKQQTQLFAVFLYLFKMFKLSTFIRIRISHLYSYDINIRVMSFLLLYFEYKSQKLTREMFDTSVGTSSKATGVFLTEMNIRSHHDHIWWLNAAVFLAQALQFRNVFTCLWNTRLSKPFTSSFLSLDPRKLIVNLEVQVQPSSDSVIWSESTSWVWDDRAYIRTYDWIFQWCIEWCTCMFSVSQSKCHSYHIKWNIF